MWNGKIQLPIPSEDFHLIENAKDHNNTTHQKQRLTDIGLPQLIQIRKCQEGLNTQGVVKNNVLHSVLLFQLESHVAPGCLPLFRPHGKGEGAIEHCDTEFSWLLQESLTPLRSCATL